MTIPASPWMGSTRNAQVLGLMALRCVQEKASQPATGLLYVMAITVLFGELFAAYLLV